MAVDTEILPPRYRSPRRIGHGAMGDIYLATDETLGRQVVVKVLSERYASDEAITARFKREGLAAARLSGESGAVTIFDVGEWEGRPFIVMEHLGGGSLEDRLGREGAQPPARALAWLEQAAATLDSAHRHGVVHRDVKPANLLLDTHDDLHVADFGIASAAGLDSMTLTGTVLGTAGYLAPEQANGERAGPASDLYALAVVAYELLSGRRPFENDSPTAEAVAHVHTPVPSIAALCENLPPELDGVFRRALAKDPAARFDSASDFVADLRETLEGSANTTQQLPPRLPESSGPGGRPRRFLIPAALLLVAAAVGASIAAFLASGGEPKTRTVVGSAGTTTVLQTVTREPAPRRLRHRLRHHRLRHHLLPSSARAGTPSTTAATGSCSRAATRARCRSSSKPSRSSKARGRATPTRAMRTTTSATRSTGSTAARRRSPICGARSSWSPSAMSRRRSASVLSAVNRAALSTASRSRRGSRRT